MFFSGYDTQCLQAQINRTGKEIDRMVYTLYGLSEEGVTVIAGGEGLTGQLI